MKKRYRLKWVKVTEGVQQEFYGEWETDRALVELTVDGVQKKFPECNPELETEVIFDGR